jgi:alkylhydroperoxidase/carboxymuconolactone decarboxylase family protein YurZ
VLALSARTPHRSCLTVRVGEALVPPGALSQGAIGTLTNVAILCELPQLRTDFKGTGAISDGRPSRDSYPHRDCA